MPRLARTIDDVLLGEGVHGTIEERYQDFLGIASVIHNRSALLGVTPKDVVSVRSEFNAYGKALPAGVERYRELAQEAWDNVQANGPIHTGTFYATPTRAHVISAGKNLVDKTKGHQFYEDPQFRSIRTAKGFKLPDPERLPEVAAAETEYATVPERRPALAAIDNLMSAPVSQAAEAIAAEETAEGLNTLGVAERTGYESPMGAQGDRITSGFGARTSPMTSQGAGSRIHGGIDMALQAGQSGYPAEAMGAGVVSDISYSPSGFGNKVSIRHPDGLTSTYGHLEGIADNLSIGTEVAAGTPVGTVGTTGRSTGNHLHFEVRDKDGNAVDPESVFSANPDPSVPAPQFADRVQPGQAISDIANAAVSPSLGDPNDALAESFDMARFGDPVRQQVGSFDAGRFGDPNAALAESFDTARFAGPSVMNEQQIAGLQQQANEARVALDTRIAQSVQTAGLGSTLPSATETDLSQPSGADAAVAGAGLSDPMMADAGVIGKTSRLPGFADAQVTVDPTYSQPTQTKVQQEAQLDMGEFAQPEAVQQYGAVTTPTAGTQSRAKQAVDQDAQHRQTENAKKGSFDKERFAKSLTNGKTIGSALGAVLGGMIAGPVGALALGGVGAKIGNIRAAERPRESPLEALFNIMTGKPQSMFPSTPPGGDGTGRGVSYADLDDRGRGKYEDSGQFRDAIDKGGVGLY